MSTLASGARRLPFHHMTIHVPLALLKAATGGYWRHETITLDPVNRDSVLIVVTGANGGEPKVIAERVEALRGQS